MYKIAIFTPLPPQQTGIASYAYDLISGLSRLDFFDITICTNDDIKIDNLNIINITKAKNINYKEFDLIIYQFGNNTNFHLFMYDILKKYGGVIHLHDIVLHQILANYLDLDKNPVEYLKTMEKYYGKTIADYLDDLLKLDVKPYKTNLAISLPCFEAFVQYSDACIVHSDFMIDKIKDKFINIPIYKIQQLYNLKSLALVSKNKKLRFGVFGGVEVNKKVDIIISSFAKAIKQSNNIDVELIIVGAVTKKCEDIYSLAKKYDIEENVIFYNLVDDDTFLNLLNSIDLLIALRDPTVGETSAVVMKALQLSKPVIVSDIGWYRELPNCIDKISNKNKEIELTTLLYKYISNKDELNNKYNTIKRYYENRLDFDLYINQYANIIKKQISLNNNGIIISKVVSYLQDFDLQNDQSTIKRISSKFKILI